MNANVTKSNRSKKYFEFDIFLIVILLKTHFSVSFINSYYKQKNLLKKKQAFTIQYYFNLVFYFILKFIEVTLFNFFWPRVIRRINIGSL